MQQVEPFTYAGIAWFGKLVTMETTLTHQLVLLIDQSCIGTESAREKLLEACILADIPHQRLSHVALIHPDIQSKQWPP